MKRKASNVLGIVIDRLGTKDLHSELADYMQHLHWINPEMHTVPRSLQAMAISKRLRKKLPSTSVAISRFVALLKTYYDENKNAARQLAELKRAFHHKDLDPKDPVIIQAFFYAVKKQLKDVVRLMLALDSNGNPTARSVDVNAQDPKTGTTALMYYLRRLGMIENGYRKDLLDVLLGARNINTNIKDKKGFTALHIATMHAAADMKTNPTDTNLANRREDAIRMLLDKGADPALKTIYGDTALMLAHASGGQAAREFLTSKFAEFTNYSNKQLNDRRMNEWGAVVANLPHAFRNGNPSAYGRHGAQTLLNATNDRNWNTVKAILQSVRTNKPFEVNARDTEGQTPLMHAARHGHAAVAELLIQSGAKVDARDSVGQTPLMYAAEEGRAAVVEVLIKRGAGVEGRDYTGKSPLMYAAGMGHAAVVEILVQSGAKVEARDSNGETPLMYATTNDKEGHAVKLLLQHGAKVEARDNVGLTPLMYATTNDKKGHAVKLLLQHGAKVDARDNDGRTPLMYASKWCNSEVVNILLGHRNSAKFLFLKDKRGHTALDIAERKFHVSNKRDSTRIIKTLREAMWQHSHIAVYDQPYGDNVLTEVSVFLDKGHCYTSVSPDYVDELVTGGKSDTMVLLRDESAHGSLVGFAAVRWRPEPKLMIVDLICTIPGKGHGDTLMRGLFQLGRKRGCDIVRLTSVYESLRFYPRYGFKQARNPCVPNAALVRTVNQSIYKKCLANMINKYDKNKVPDKWYSTWTREYD